MKNLAFTIVMNYLSKNIFCAVINFINYFRKLNIKFKYIDSKYCLFENNLKYFFTDKRNGYIQLSRGIKAASKNIGEIYMLNKIDFKDKDIIIDVGANIGILSTYFYFNKIQTNYFGIEPSPQEFNDLKKNVKIFQENFKLYDCAVSNEDKKELSFNIDSEGGDSSLIFKSINKLVKVKPIKLNAFQNMKIKLIKLETEGTEPEALESMNKVVHNIEYISADLGYERLGQSTYEASKKILNNYGFEEICSFKNRSTFLFLNKNLKQTI